MYKDFYVINLKRNNYDKKLQSMVDERITNDETYRPSTKTTPSNVKKFQDSFHRCFKDKFTHYNDMRPASNQTGRLYPTANTHKFSLLDGITVENLKFLPIISQVGITYTYNAAKFIADYLKPLCQNECKIIDTQSFPSILKEETLPSSNEEYVSNDE